MTTPISPPLSCSYCIYLRVSAQQKDFVSFESQYSSSGHGFDFGRRISLFSNRPFPVTADWRIRFFPPVFQYCWAKMKGFFCLSIASNTKTDKVTVRQHSVHDQNVDFESYIVSSTSKDVRSHRPTVPIQSLGHYVMCVCVPVCTSTFLLLSETSRDPSAAASSVAFSFRANRLRPLSSRLLSWNLKNRTKTTIKKIIIIIWFSK